MMDNSPSSHNNSTVHTIRLAEWNANGLLNHRQELLSFINTNKLDIILVSETHFTDRSYIKIPRFTVYDTKHPDGRAHGGTAILIRSNLRHYESAKFQTEKIQSTAVVIEDWNGPITIAAVYCPPRHSISETEFEDFFRSLGRRFVAGGATLMQNIPTGVRD